MRAGRSGADGPDTSIASDGSGGSGGTGQPAEAERPIGQAASDGPTAPGGPAQRTVPTTGPSGRSLGRSFAWLWAAYAASAFGTRFAFDAFTLIAILVLHVGPTQVSLLAATGLAVGAAVAVPLGPWVEFRRKRPVMVAMDLIRFAALLSVPATYALGALSFAQLLLVSVVVAAADITFTAASGAYLKWLVRPEDLLVANGRFESTTWTATVLGPPVGGVAIGLFGPLTTVVANAVSHLVSAAGIQAIGGREPRPVRTGDRRFRAADVLEGWRYILTHPALRPLFLNTVLVNALIMAPAPLLAFLMLGPLGYAPWQYAVAFAVPCVGGIIGSRLAPPLVARFGRHRVMLTAGTLRACWPLALAFVGPGPGGLVLVITVELGLITCIGVFNPVYATYRLEQTPTDRVVRMLSAWSVTGKTTTAALTALWGLLAAVTGPRTAIALAGLLLLITPVLLLRQDYAPKHVPEGRKS
ncbi:MFS transporter [Streptomyces sp. NPDC050433]|uniref:MFS transporter n=1 Tax=Streptomyces sp. NPDC050433 TaxID=3365615 RepID=UPI0037B995CF